MVTVIVGVSCYALGALTYRLLVRIAARRMDKELREAVDSFDASVARIAGRKAFTQQHGA